jgi:hypothetical protein
MSHSVLSRLLPAVPVVLLAALVASCGPARNEFAPACPVPEIARPPLSELSRYRGASRDVRDLVIRARIVDIPGKCKPGDTGILDVTAQVVIDVTRGPGLQGAAYDLPVFLAVTDAAAVRDKTLIALRVVFERNQDTARVATQPIEMALPVSMQRSGASYGLIAGFQLLPQEVEEFRQNARR